MCDVPLLFFSVLQHDPRECFSATCIYILTLLLVFPLTLKLTSENKSKNTFYIH